MQVKKNRKDSIRLNGKQLLFCHEYVVDQNGTQAAIRAGYKPHSAHVHASKLLRMPKVQEKLQELTKSLADKCGVTAEMVMQEYKRLAFYDVLDSVDQNTGELKKNCDGRLISSISITPTVNGIKRVVKFHGKDRALEVLAKAVGVLKPDESKIFTADEIKSFMNVIDKLKG